MTGGIPTGEMARLAAVVVGGSAGGFAALRRLLPHLGKTLCVPVFVVQHIRADADDVMVRHLDSICPVRVKEAEDKEVAEPGTVYLAPPDYHLMLEPDGSLALSQEDRVHHSRPAIDVLFSTASEVHGKGLLGVVLTGGSRDGADGLWRIHECGGLCVVEDPETADVATMPKMALEKVPSAWQMEIGILAAFLKDALCPGDEHEWNGTWNRHRY